MSTITAALNLKESLRQALFLSKKPASEPRQRAHGSRNERAQKGGHGMALGTRLRHRLSFHPGLAFLTLGGSQGFLPQASHTSVSRQEPGNDPHNCTYLE